MEDTGCSNRKSLWVIARCGGYWVQQEVKFMGYSKMWRILGSAEGKVYRLKQDVEDTGCSNR